MFQLLLFPSEFIYTNRSIRNQKTKWSSNRLIDCITDWQIDILSCEVSDDSLWISSRFRVNSYRIKTFSYSIFLFYILYSHCKAPLYFIYSCCNAIKQNTIQYNTTQHNSTQHNTSAHNTAQPDTINQYFTTSHGIQIKAAASTIYFNAFFILVK